MELLAGLAAEGRSVIVTLHELHLAARWCRRLLLLNGGVLVADGPAAQVLTQERLADVYGVKAYLSAGEGGPVIVPVERLAPPS
jgi:iron complex transport system ATP-binding protein